MANHTNEDEIGLEDHDTTEEMETDFKKVVNNNVPELIEIGDSLDGIASNPILLDIAKSNQVNTPWQELQTILKDIVTKQCEAMQNKLITEDIRNTVDTVKTNIIHIIEEHTNCPFTIQRLCELVNEPKKNYKMYIKYLRAVEKVLMVTSYWEDFVDIYNEAPAEDKSQTGDRLVPSFVTGMELEPHNFDLTVSEETETALPKEEKENEDEEIVEDEDEEIIKEEGENTNTTTENKSGSSKEGEEGEEKEEEKEIEKKETEEEKGNGEKEVEINQVKASDSENVENDKKKDSKDIDDDESKMELDQKEEE